MVLEYSEPETKDDMVEHGREEPGLGAKSEKDDIPGLGEVDDANPHISRDKRSPEVDASTATTKGQNVFTRMMLVGAKEQKVVRRTKRARRRCVGGSVTPSVPSGTIRKYFPNISSIGMTGTKRMADDLVELNGAGAVDGPGAVTVDEIDDGASADGRRMMPRWTTMPDVGRLVPMIGAKSVSGKRMLGLDSVSSQGDGRKGSWKWMIAKKNLELLDKKSHGNSIGGGKSLKY